MANEVTRVYGTLKTLEANGASTANNVITQADDAAYSTTTDGSNYPDARFVLSFTYSVAPTEGTVIALVARTIDIDGTNDAEVPEATRADRYIGSFTVNNVTTLQYAECVATDVPVNAHYYILNSGTGQTIGAGWTLKVTPQSYKPAV
jgi:hypothetical protein